MASQGASSAVPTTTQKARSKRQPRPVAPARKAKTGEEDLAERRARLMAEMEAAGEVAPDGERIEIAGRIDNLRLSPAEWRRLALKATELGPLSELIIQDRR
ncbi:MAG: hypothetical protein COZ06_27205 [Armatimonadetes bacterium CG_4_10_14_3_um_filter_66_18]|nr:hypothetical protein [Armatimonadota bacterium]OIP00679.1 MAG: hypothetical protein AUJ96_18285 [Armatimonadetes bacterium CG2_30_66_41]PIU90845.1 MAG: hypothetical protein COS65_23965 [Armatimonadetes bacterium CG06_land_8_20_14_3_00_66_21]PIX40176.1 MAG: hypothetical protein COZ57_26580 [Armatimonadetes bacterium CG_4_8_14_3_um_filter_66_20]PIY41057.1 MAG: hypothetical protein COZ06_27205 [Armatimonadetes bacterium CG_4_10_14_3_um_filter_66_18]PJB67565.1 MAG: hypothetical protein CO096_15